MKSARQTVPSIFVATVGTLALVLGIPALSTVAAATPAPYTASTVDGAIPSSLDGITLTKAPSFSGADEGIYELRSTISTYLGAIQLNHTGAFYGRGGSSSELCYVGCSLAGSEKAFALTFTLPAGTTAFAIRINPQDNGATTYTVTGPGSTAAQFVWDGRGSSNANSAPTLAVSAVNGSTIDSVTIAATQSDGCTYEDEGPTACSLYGLDISDVAIGDGVVNGTSTTTTTEPAPTTLSSTGSNTGKVLVVGSALVLFGAASMLAARRHSRRVR